MINEVRTELRFAWRSFVIPAALVLCALLALANVLNTSQTVRLDYGQVQHTRAEYKLNHMDFEADLAKPVDVRTTGNDQVVGNLARYDFDAMATAVAAMSPASSVAETLKYFGFLIWPALFFLIGLWLATGQRRYRLDKVTQVRAGPTRSIASKQITLVIIAVLTIAATLLVDVVVRSIVRATLASQLPLSAFAPLSPLPSENAAAQWGVIALVTVFFGGAGIAIGTLAGVLALPAIVFLAYDFVLPIFVANDPRNWFEVLGHSVFTYSATFELAEPIPLATPIALTATLVVAAILVALGYLGIRIRNPRAT